MNLIRRFPRVALTFAAAIILTTGAHRLAQITHADEPDAPSVQAFANAPGWITVTWTSDSGASQYTLLRQDIPSIVRPVEGSGTLTDTGLKPSTVYSYRVCADGACSDWVQARTLDANGGSNSGTSPNHGTAAGAPTGVRVLATSTLDGDSAANIGWTPGTGATTMEISCQDKTQPSTLCGLTGGTLGEPWTIEPSDGTTGMAVGQEPGSGNAAGSPPALIPLDHLKPAHTYLLTVCDSSSASPSGTTDPACAAAMSFHTAPQIDTSADSHTTSPTCAGCGPHVVDTTSNPVTTFPTCHDCGNKPPSTTNGK